MERSYEEIISEPLLKSIQLMTEKTIEDLDYSKVIEAQIIDDSRGSKGIYTVLYGVSSFEAFSKDTSFSNGDLVQIIFPNKNNDGTKIILGKSAKIDEKEYIIDDSFEKYINITGNLIELMLNSNKSLLANGDTREKLLWRYIGNPQDLLNYSTIGLEAGFQSLLNNAIEGEYGLKIEITTSNDVISYYLNTEDMSGNPYNYESFYPYKKLFKIPNQENLIINDISLYFYQETGSFKDSSGNLILSQDSFYNDLPFNLFVDDIHLSFGFLQFEYTPGESKVEIKVGEGYNLTYGQDSPEAVVNLSWIRWNDDNTKILTQEENIQLNDFKIEWYYYEKKVDYINNINKHYEDKSFEFNRMAEEDASLLREERLNSVGCEYIKNDNWQKITDFDDLFSVKIKFNINGTNNYQIRAFIICDDNMIYQSNTLNFTNIAYANVKLNQISNGMNIEALDGSFGNYYCYTSTNILNNEDKKTRTLKLKYYDNEGNEVNLIDNETYPTYSIEWIVPEENTMIIGKMNPSNNTEFQYIIKNLYDITATNNTILCRVTETYEDGVVNVYESTYDFNFGQSGNAFGNNIIVVDFANLQEIREITSHDYKNLNTLINNLYSKILSLEEWFEENFTKYQTYYGEIQNLLNSINSEEENEESILTEEDKESILNQIYILLNETHQKDEELLDNYFNSLSEEELNDDILYQYRKSFIDALNDIYKANQNNEKIKDQNILSKKNILYTKNAIQADQTEEMFIVKMFNSSNEEIDLSQSYDISWELKVYNKNNGELQDNDTYDLSQNKNIVKITRYATNNSNEKIAFGMDYLLILKVTITKENTKLSSWLEYPIAISSDLLTYNHVVGTTSIIYKQTGGTPIYYPEPYKIYSYDSVEQDVNWSLAGTALNGNNKDTNRLIKLNEDNVIEPLGTYLTNAENEQYGFQCLIENELCWIQPITIVRSAFVSTTINSWDGKTVDIKEANGTIAAMMIAAGKKEGEDGVFTGVMMGDLSTDISNGEETFVNTGLYGFQKGFLTFGLKDDGTAFFGKKDRGQILIDGEKSSIVSQSYEDIKKGLKFDLDDAIIDVRNKIGDNEYFLTIDASDENIFKIISDEERTPTTDTFPLKIGIGNEPNFTVNWRGELNAKQVTINGTLVAGANSEIGPWKVTTNAIYNSKTGNLTSTNTSEGVYLGIDGLNISGGTSNTTTYITKSAMSIGGGKLTWNGSTLTVTGEINATSGKIGGSNGWTITTNQISSNGMIINSSSGINFNNVFKVTNTGALTATNANIKGEIKATSGWFGDSGDNTSNNIKIMYTSNNIKYIFFNDNFRIQNNGNFYLGPETQETFYISKASGDVACGKMYIYGDDGSVRTRIDEEGLKIGLRTALYNGSMVATEVKGVSYYYQNFTYTNLSYFIYKDGVNKIKLGDLLTINDQEGFKISQSQRLGGAAEPYVLIGKRNHSYILDIKGEVRIQNGGITADTAIIRALAFKNGSDYGIYNGGGEGVVRSFNLNNTFYNFFGNPSEKTRLNGDTITSSPPISSDSDIRLKENILPLKNAKDFVMGIEPFEFYWKNNTPKKLGLRPDIKNFGVSAQQVIKQMQKNGMNPEKYSFVNQVGEYYTVAYTDFIPFLIQVVKDLEKEIQELKEKINE